MVIKPVPAGATAVGNPARVILPETKGDFAPYGLQRADDDPLAKVLQELIDHTAQQDAHIQRLCAALEELGQRVDNSQHPLDAARLNQMME